MKLTKEQQQEIKDQQSQENKTKRVTVAELENILYEAIPILDHGFIRVIDYMGDDTSIVQAARVSYGKGTKKVSTDSGLIAFITFCTIFSGVEAPEVIPTFFTPLNQS